MKPAKMPPPPNKPTIQQLRKQEQERPGSRLWIVEKIKALLIAIGAAAAAAVDLILSLF